MADENWQKIREIFDVAVGCKPDERKSYIKKACRGDNTLLREVKALLSSFERAESFMETPAVAKVADIIEAETRKHERGTHFAHYEIIEQIMLNIDPHLDSLRDDARFDGFVRRVGLK